MNITKAALLQRGFEERVINGEPVYIKGRMAIVNNSGLWIPCYYAPETPLATQLSIKSMEDLDILSSLL